MVLELAEERSRLERTTTSNLNLRLREIQGVVVFYDEELTVVSDSRKKLSRRRSST